MNLENLKKLKAFFDDGAPHFHLDMNLPFGSTNRTSIQTFTDSPIPEDCKSAGCIAGAAYMLFDKQPNLHLALENSWDEIMPKAMEYLGLPENEGEGEDEDEDDFFGHPLFNQWLCPKGCTATQAAQAIDNVINGKEPW